MNSEPQLTDGKVVYNFLFPFLVCFSPFLLYLKLHLTFSFFLQI